MPTKGETSLTFEQLQALLAELAALSANPTGEQISAAFSARGIDIKKDSALNFKKGAWARYTERVIRGRQLKDAFMAAVAAGTPTLDALEEAMVIELQDHLENADGGVDVKFVVDLLVKLRASISMREEARRKQTDLERKLADSEKAREVASANLKLRDEQVAKLERDAADWKKKRDDAKAALATVAKKGGITPDTRRLIEQAMGGDTP